LKLEADIGEDVLEVMPRAQQADPKLRTKALIDSLCNTGTLQGTLRVPDTVGDIDVLVDLKARQNVVSVNLEAPKDKGGKGRIGWLVRQLRDAPDALVIEAYAKNSRNGLAASLAAVREDSSLLLGPDKTI